jgi:hypothetical protein
MTILKTLIVAGLCLVRPVVTSAEAVDIHVDLSTTEPIKMDFSDGSKHFVLMVKREGTAEGEGMLAGANVVEYGWHDINPGQNADPLGYLEVTIPNGDIAYLKWHVRGVFLGGNDKGPPVVHGVWELISGTGSFADIRGVGSLSIGPVTTPKDPERRFTLTGTVGPKP